MRMQHVRGFERRTAASIGLAILLSIGSSGFEHAGRVHAAELHVFAQAGKCANQSRSGKYCSLQDAVLAANTSAEPDVIWLERGATYTLVEVDHFNEGGNGLAAIVGVLTIEGNGAVIERSRQPTIAQFRLFRVQAEGELLLRQLTVRNGATHAGFDGAGIWNLGKLTLDSCTLEDNHSGDDGGAIRNDGVLRISDSTAKGNSAHWRGGVGGALQNNTQFGKAHALIERSTFERNEASASGGALWLQGNIVIADTVLSGNRAGERGGAIHNYGVLELRGTRITDNQAGLTGGGLYTFSSVAVAATRISGNRALVESDCEGRLVSRGGNEIAASYGCKVVQGNAVAERASVGAVHGTVEVADHEGGSAAALPRVEHANCETVPTTQSKKRGDAFACRVKNLESGTPE